MVVIKEFFFDQIEVISICKRQICVCNWTICHLFIAYKKYIYIYIYLCSNTNNARQ